MVESPAILSTVFLSLASTSTLARYVKTSQMPHYPLRLKSKKKKVSSLDEEGSFTAKERALPTKGNYKRHLQQAGIDLTTGGSH